MFRIVLSLVCAFASLNCTVIAKEATLSETALDFTEVAKKAVPAVVSIKVKGSTKITSPSGRWGESDDDLNDLFSDDFFKRFFGLPKIGGKENESSTPTAGQASGFIVSSEGYVLTNSHVVKDFDEIIVKFEDGREFTGTVVGQDPNTDIAVVKIDAKDLPFLTLGNSDDLQVGQWVVAIGTPLGLQASLTVGVVSAKGRNNLDLARIEDFIQTDAAINRGNSGGPLLNLKGEVIGMNTAIFTNNLNGGYMGIGFAIPSNLLKHIMNELISTGKVTRGFLGVMMQQMDPNLAKAFSLDKTEGAIIAEITKDSPAEKAGLKQGDIILKYNKQPVKDIAALRNTVALMKPGANITLTILRDGKTQDISMNVGTFPTESEIKASQAKENKYGFSVQELTPEVAHTLGLHDDKGVVINSVEAGTPAAWAGLKKGAFILAVNQKKIASVAEFNKALEETEKGKPVLLLVKTGESVRFVSLQVN